MRKLNQLLAGVSVAVLVAFQAQATCVPADCSAMGYTKSAADCNGTDMIKCPFDTNKVWCVESKCQEIDPVVGAIYNSDGTFMDVNCIIEDKIPIGVVAYMNGSKRFAVALEESSYFWSNPGYYDDITCLANLTNQTTARADLNGTTNTSCIANYAGRLAHPAATYCKEYQPVSSGKGSSGWYLPAVGEVVAMNSNLNTINITLTKLLATPFTKNGTYWSSSEYSEKYAWRFINSSSGTEDKNTLNLVRCVLAF